MTIDRACLFGGTALSVGLLIATSAAAQASTGRATDSTELDEIVVTAQRTAESLQNVPLAVSAFGQKELEAAHIYQAQDLQAQVPGLFYGKFGSTNSQIALRGVGNLNQSIGGEQGVAVVKDGVVIGRPGAAANQIFDLERIEVLRGPQGTLYGRNTTGGVINMVTQAPTYGEFGGSGDLLFASYNQLRLRAAVNVPLSERSGLRLSVLSDTRDGYGKNTFNGLDIGDEKYRALRLQYGAELTDTLDLRIIGEMFAQKTGGSRLGFGIPQPGVTPVPQPFPSNPRDNARDNPEYSDNEGNSVAVILRNDFGWATLTSTTAFVRTRFDALVDYDASEVPWAWIRRKDMSDQVSQELQLTSDRSSDSRVKWVAGLFYFHEDVATYARFKVNPSIFIVGDGRVVTNSIAAYGQGSYDITPKLTVTVGLRYTIDHKTGFEHNLITSGGVTTDPEAHFADRWPSFTPKFGVDYQLSDAVLLYGSVTKGFQSGGYNIGSLQGRGYDPESLWAYEGGVKSRFLENRLQVNVAAFYYDYKDIITQNRQPGVALTFLENAAKARVQGIEFETVAAPTSRIRLSLNIGYLDAKYSKYSTQDPDRNFTLFNLKGNRLPFSPEWSFSGTAQYTVPLSVGDLVLRAEHRRLSTIHFTSFNVPIASQTGYGKTNLRILFTPSEGRWDGELFVENLEDKLTRSNVLVQRGQQHATTWYDAP
ncbi:MAG: hypothetical protein DI570_11715, partial [Phenylobacterium zucineum]